MKHQPQKIYLKDYIAPDYRIEETHLSFALHETHTHVHARLFVRKNTDTSLPLVLNGQELTLKNISIDNRALSAEEYAVTPTTLTISHVPAQCMISIDTLIYPHENTALTGLYFTKGIYCTQCEAHGFQRITYYLDRPDILSKFTTRIEADKTLFPVLLSNGNCVDKGESENNRHWVMWQDPFPKPAYLFALVAGSFACLQETFVTMSGRKIDLRLYLDKTQQHKGHYALQSLQRAMHWDEIAYGREYDLDIYMIVAVNDFNMGAMENKGLNVFNDKYILADEEIATDIDYENIQAVVGHEYFHNWSGNRVTLRDWFQLSLKEGFTVFREHEFSEAMWKSGVNRVENARLIRSVQFAEDAGPMAHPVRPDSYIEINNFYTTTVYEKGSEVIRMLKTLLGEKIFRQGTDRYFMRFDGSAATTDDFIEVMSEVSGRDLTQFYLWYSQAGTPELNVTWEYQPDNAITFSFTQKTSPTPGQAEKKPVVIPVKIALIDKTGAFLPLKREKYALDAPQETVVTVDKATQPVIFYDIPHGAIPSLLRGFSAPIKLKASLTDDELGFLVLYDNDPYVRWDAMQTLYFRAIQQILDDGTSMITVSDALKKSFLAVLLDQKSHPGLSAMLLQIPSENDIAERQTQIDVDKIHEARAQLQQLFALEYQDKFAACYQKLAGKPYVLDDQGIGERSLKNMCLRYLALANFDKAENLIEQQFTTSRNMTDTLAAMAVATQEASSLREKILAAFYDKFQTQPLVLDKWFAVQASSNASDTLAQVKRLLAHPAFDIKNPNKVYALLRQFSSNNPYYFHAQSGEGYHLVLEKIKELNTLNPQVAARIITAFTHWRRYDKGRQEKMRVGLQALEKLPNLSQDLYEIIHKTLQVE